MITISRLYDDYDTAARAVADLERAGIPHDDISIIANNAEGWYDDDGSRTRRIDRDADGTDDRVEGAATGAGIGATRRRRRRPARRPRIDGDTRAGSGRRCRMACLDGACGSGGRRYRRTDRRADAIRASAKTRLTPTPKACAAAARW